MSKALEFLVSEDRHSMSKIADIAAVGKIEAAQVHDGYFQKNKICWDIRVEHPQMAYYIRLIWGPVAKFQDMIEAFEFDQSALQKEIMIGTVLLYPMSGVTMDNMHQDPRFRELEKRTSKITTAEGLCYTCIHQPQGGSDLLLFKGISDDHLSLAYLDDMLYTFTQAVPAIAASATDLFSPSRK